MRVVLVTGMLASGKSIALRVFQDLGYYCIDNLPPSLVAPFVELSKKSDPVIEKVAFVIDVRAEGFFGELESAIEYLEAATDFDILFIDAADETLLARYKLNRRRHLMFENGRIEQTIQHEREKLSPIKAKSDYIIDTTDLNEAALKTQLKDIFGSDDKDKKKFLINVVSFGFKYGILKDADMVYDARFLPNPYYIETLKHLSGLDKAVSSYVMGYIESGVFVDKICDMLGFLLPYYIREGKQQLVIGIGCSGGRHRSVTITEQIAARLRVSDYIISVEHRDIDKEQ